MGGLKKPKKRYLAGKPKKIWNKSLLLEELQLMGEYGLRNKKELWLARARLKWIVRRARSLLSMTAEERAPLEMPFKEKLYKMGFIEDPNVSLDRILSLDVRAVLERRLQTVIYRMGLAKSIYHARQLIVHGHVAVAGRRVTSPGFLVPRELEDKISLIQ
ncbi:MULTISPECIES: 30S ribosomal protein S4 [Pyrobaculum]|uniref:Small ribosomal subunit protein uS4 n=1 Tax=Pyrobaculum ferrireducens TaxID=1104324 RepID=G7VGV9_9CREN|nr:MULTISPECIES: 30S ribosomal protein S4 [Pyrobaculum]AET31942.1 30S ribosomal protein S4 [Pyrobaculum ferrireducens]MCU7786517.1 30S ribosomal protein S4 [Pyrobaculum sp. 3827-6]